MLIKICGVRDPKTARYAAEQGADFIGIILSQGFMRTVDIDMAREIAAAARAAGAEPVGVFVKASAAEIEEVCAQTGIAFVQAYEIEEPLSLRQMHVNTPDAQLKPGDFLLMERAVAARPYLLAGGLTPENVRAKIEQFQPIGVDVSSGVEKDGIKNFERIAKFIEEARR